MAKDNAITDEELIGGTFIAVEVVLGTVAVAIIGASTAIYMAWDDVWGDDD